MTTRSQWTFTLLTTFLWIALSTPVTWAETLTTGSLIEEMIDLYRLADFPEPAYKTVQFSSYDRRSTHPGGPLWYANADGFGDEPIPNFEAVLQPPNDQGIGEYLVCDVTGPGAIVRTWTAAITGTLRVYLDSADEPVYNGRAKPFFLKPYKKYVQQLGLDGTLYNRTFYQRNAAYCPMPFAKRCRIIWRGNIKKVHFYEIQLRQYEPGTDVLTFKPQDLKTYEDTLKRVAKVLANPNKHWPYTASHEPLSMEATVEPGKSATLLTVKGPQALERLTLKVSAREIDQALRQTLLHIAFDEYRWAQVQSPIGDFFGAAPGINPYESVPFTVKPDGTMTTRYVMPFAQSLQIRIENRGKQPVTITGSALPADYIWNPDKSMHFRARWRVNHNLFHANVRIIDMPYLIANGTGVYVGTATYLLNPNNIPSKNGSWWGEGDEKIFVDDDVQPSTFGTGSEDYYNYAWSSNDIFTYPYGAQPRADGPANRGFIANNRYHILDPLPFKQRLSFYIELFPHLPTAGTSYARIAYHYAQPGLMDDHVPVTDEDLRHLELPPNWQPVAEVGAADAVFYQAENLVEDKTAITFTENRLWSGNKMAVWQPTHKGDELTLQVPIPEDGEYHVFLFAARTPNSAMISATLNGQPHIGGKKGVTDLYDPYRVRSRWIYARPKKLTKGKHTLVLRHEGHADKVTQPIVGLDFVMVQKRQR